MLQSLPAGSHVVSVGDVYGGTYRYMTRLASAHGVEVSFTSSIETELAGLIRPGATRLVWIESPSNPTLSVVDISAVVGVAHGFDGVKVVVDNTFLSPYIQSPLALGADVVLHSVTKYINGHSDVLMGVLATDSDELREKLFFLQYAVGSVPGAFDCWLAHRGLKTLHLRMREASRNALMVARALEKNPLIEAVNYPGLESHPRRDVVRRQHRDGLGGGMLSFRIRVPEGLDGAEVAGRFCRETKLFALAESLGGVESLVEVPATMTHASVPKVHREANGVFDDLVRMSCGIEDGEDLVWDVQRALEVATSG